MSRSSRLSIRLGFAASMIAIGSIAFDHAAAQEAIPLTPDRLTLKGVVAESVKHLDRPAIRLIESDKSRNTLGLAVVNGVSFRDGTIGVDVAGRRGPYAVSDDRGFIGAAFRITPTANRFECVYLRPDNGRADDQVRSQPLHAVRLASGLPVAATAQGVSGKVRVVRRSRTWDVDAVSVRRLRRDGTAVRPRCRAANPRCQRSQACGTEGGIALWNRRGFSNIRVRASK